MAAPTRQSQSATSEHKPYVPDEFQIPEMTWPAVTVGALLGIVFGANAVRNGFTMR